MIASSPIVVVRLGGAGKCDVGCRGTGIGATCLVDCTDQTEFWDLGCTLACRAECHGLHSVSATAAVRNDLA